MSLTLIDDIRASLEDVPQSITGVPQIEWVTNHIFYNDSRAIGTGPMNRGRCPFVRFYRNGKDYSHDSNGPRGGTLFSEFTIEIIVSKPSVKSQEDSYDLAWEIWNSFINDLRTKDNYLIGDDRTLQMQINPLLFVLQCIITVENSF